MSEETTESIAPEEPRLYAGKFKSVEDLEKGYNEGMAVHLKNKELESKISEVTSIPESYQIPDGIHLRDSQLKEIKELAKRASMNQDQFAGMVNKYNEDTTSKLKAIDERINAVGEEKVNLVKGYVEKNFADFDESFRGDVLNRVIKDDRILEKVMSDRDKELNSSVPGMDQVSSTVERHNDMRKEKYEAALKCKMDPRDKRAREKYINLCRDIGHSRQEG